MKKLALAFALSLLSVSAFALDDCRDRMIEVTLQPNALGNERPPVTVEHECIGPNTLVVLFPVSRVSTSYRYWQDFPNTVPGEAVIHAPFSNSEPIRLLGWLR